jgi:hypothetical protein
MAAVGIEQRQTVLDPLPGVRVSAHVTPDTFGASIATALAILNE